MRMSCNIVEVVRLREELIDRVYECQILESVYKQLNKLFNKESKTDEEGDIGFTTQNIMPNDIWNYIDLNDGSHLKFNLPFVEFDHTLSAKMDFSSESCIKSLLTDLGVEELRAILHYQIMQQQLLTIAVKFNMLLAEGPQRGIKELELLNEYDITVPNAIINIYDLFSTNTDMMANSKKKSEETRILQKFSKMNEHVYLIRMKKARERKIMKKKFDAAVTKIASRLEIKPETKLRVLRAYRLQLLHQFCETV